MGERTEKHAKHSWCHLKPDEMQFTDNYCKGRACMAWRWSERQPAGLGYDSRGVPGSDDAYGYCGLAGPISWPR